MFFNKEVNFKDFSRQLLKFKTFSRFTNHGNCPPTSDVYRTVNGRLVKTKITFEVTQISGSSETRRHMRDSGRVFIKMRMSRSSHIRESKTVLDSGFHLVDSGFLEQKIPGLRWLRWAISGNLLESCWQDRELAKFGIETFLYLFSNLHWKTRTHSTATLSSFNRRKDTRRKVSLNSLVMDKDNINSTFTFSTE